MTLTDSADRPVLVPSAGGLPPEPDGGLIGRATEQQAMMAALCDAAQRGPVLVYGYEGVGKTTLVAHLARQAVRDGRYANAVYTRFIGGGHSELALYDLGQRLVGAELKMQSKDAEEQVTRALRQTPTLILWDHLEALLPGGDELPSVEVLGDLLALGARLTASGESRLCLLADGPTIPDALRGRTELAFSQALTGLADADGLAMLRALLPAECAARADEPEALALVHALGGHPLALSLLAAAAANQPTQPLAALWRALETVLPGLSTGEALLRNQGLEAAVEAWLRSFDEAARLQVLSLAPFVGGLMAPLASTIALEEHRDWNALMPRLVAARALHLVEIPGLSAQYAYLAPGLARRLDQRLTEPQRAHLLPRYTGAYGGVLGWMGEHEAQSAQSMLDLFRCELPNVRHALRLLLAGEQLSTGRQLAAQAQVWLARLGWRGEWERVAAQVKAATSAAIPKEGPLPRAGMQLMLAQAEQLSSTGQMPQALSVLAGLEKRVMADKGLAYSGEEALLDRGVLLHMLGRCLATMHQRADAIQRFARAVEYIVQVTQTERVRQELASLYGHMGEMHLASQQPDLAASALSRGLALAEGVQDRHLMGLIQVGLASVSAGRGDDADALTRLQAALDHLRASGDVAALVGVWEQMAVLALHRRDAAEAERAFGEALACAIEAGNPGMQAQVTMQLGRVAEGTKRDAEARTRYERVIQLAREHKLAQPLQAAEMALAALLLRQGETQLAKEHAMEARAMADQVGAQARPWQTYELLARVEEAEGNPERVAHWRLAAIESYAATPEAQTALARWTKLTTAILQACKGDSLQLEAVDALEKLEGEAGWQAFVGAIWSILAGERGAELYTGLDYVQGAVVRNILTELQKQQ